MKASRFSLFSDMGEFWEDGRDFPDFYDYGFYDGFFYSFVRNVPPFLQ